MFPVPKCDQTSPGQGAMTRMRTVEYAALLFYLRATVTASLAFQQNSSIMALVKHDRTTGSSGTAT